MGQERALDPLDPPLLIEAPWTYEMGLWLQWLDKVDLGHRGGEMRTLKPISHSVSHENVKYA